MDSVGNIILYFIIALAIIVFSVLAVTTRKILRAATYLLFVLFATAFVYFQLDFEFWVPCKLPFTRVVFLCCLCLLSCLRISLARNLSLSLQRSAR